jgi:hypothetical protein
MKGRAIADEYEEQLKESRREYAQESARQRRYVICTNALDMLSLGIELERLERLGVSKSVTKRWMQRGKALLDDILEVSDPLRAPLQVLLGEEFVVATARIPTGDALLRILEKRPEVTALKQSLRNRKIREQDIHRFHLNILLNLRTGEKLKDEEALAAIAVALSHVPTEFSDNFIRNLALSYGARQEMPLAPQVAQLILRNREQVQIEGANR